MKCLRSSGSARIARVGRVGRVRRICKLRSPRAQSLTYVRYRSGRIPSLENDARVSRKKDDEPYDGDQKRRRCVPQLHIYITF